MEGLAFFVLSSGMGYIIHLQHSMERRLDSLSERLTKLEAILPRRKTDIDS